MLFLIWLRSGEKGHVERLDDLFWTYVYGAIVATLIAIVLEIIATTYLLGTIEAETDLFTNNPNAVTFAIIIIIAPLIEEYAKAQGVVRISKYIWRPRNGLIFGAACGLGFAATENLLYEGTAFFSLGFEAFISIALIRIFSSALMHGSATSISGYGIARSKVYGEVMAAILWVGRPHARLVQSVRILGRVLCSQVRAIRPR